MAAETDKTEKTQAELIKRSQAESSAQAGEAKAKAPGAPESGEKRKVILRAKKPAAQGAPEAKAKKPQPVVRSAQKPAAAPPEEAKSAPRPQPVERDRSRDEVSASGGREAAAPGGQEAATPGRREEASASGRREAGAPGVQEPAASRAQDRPASAEPPHVTEAQERPQSESGQPDKGGPEAPPQGYPFAQRPAVVAGRVGGRFMGRKPDENRPPHQGRPGGSSGFQQRPPYQGGRPPGPPRQGFGGPGSGQQGSLPTGFVPRQSGGPPGRTGFVPRQGQGAPGRPGFVPRPGFTPRPGGPPGRPGFAPRPGGPGGRPGAGSGSTTAVPENKGATKRSFKAKKPAYTRKEKELEMQEKLLQTKKKISHAANSVPKSIEMMEAISLSELAKKMKLKASELIQKLMKMGMMVTINQQIDADTATILAAEYGTDVKIVSLYDETVIETEEDDEGDLLPRPPVVTVMGHVDHGKTKLLDAIRKADVVAGEFGGITQHIGAYMVDTPKGSITFLDTPGHEAFTKMRARGAQVTDIVVLVVAADDGVMPQTVEAINHAKEAKVPIVVAINKVDKPEANLDRVKSQLSDLGLMPEEWGGKNIFVEISALQKTGIDKLIDAVLLEAELADLKANYKRAAEGKILESRVETGRGIVATIMVEKGTVAVGNSFVAGIWPGKVRAIFNDKGEKLKHATPSMPVEILGFEGIPNAGDPIQVV
ncbi:MAG: translation initiation factor IF-2, partial [Treponema sp.]|nr:translation initiation factor IF-2 [Treponema sp.]